MYNRATRSIGLAKASIVGNRVHSSPIKGADRIFEPLKGRVSAEIKLILERMNALCLSTPRHDTFCKKTVYCNCDDPFESNFFKYFATNINNSASSGSSAPATTARRLPDR